MVEPYYDAYVFTRTSGGELTRVGQLSARPPVGTFRYDSQWLENRDAYPLDPENLPLKAHTFRTTNRKAVFGVFTDAGPDDWGTRVLLLNNSSTPKNEIERLLRTSGSGVGTLAFSLSRSATRPASQPPDITLLAELSNVIQKVSERETLTSDQLALIEPGSSMGGARPKVVVCEGEESWLVKFSRVSDPVDIPRLEYATMKLLFQAGFHVPEVRLEELGNGQTAFLIKRFDRTPGQPVHFLSANSLFNLDRVRTVRDSKLNPYSYINLARILRHHSSEPERDCHELFRRMVFNILIGNVDDHARNHGMIYEINQQRWGIAPAYDVLPTIHGAQGRQAMGVGVDGANSTKTNALSYANLFMLDKTTANRFYSEVKAIAEELPHFAQQAGMAAAEQSILTSFLKATTS
ncbi:type II toxin-antitoxin system HipA family toxin [Marinimicrobium sp. ARAG 43.8]|uniref:type II toxin-antitoxin system HipA family toxin n=1 Tax=Marinimicrobium sp. ARAG 43.8 TaxID=3418719 RepID=UPI003CECFE33